MSTTAGWAVLMYRGVAGRGVDLEPQQHYSIPTALFFVSFIIVGSLFMLNLLVGIVISTYNREKEKLDRKEHSFATEEQQAYIRTKIIEVNIK